tara:strand:+ start:1739 stop:2380 length:642 start_codon:yes stop_codon:yes gene_type:complete
MSLSKKVSECLGTLDCKLSTPHNLFQERIYRYLLLIEKWNRIHNLTAIRKPEEMLSQHIMDSLSVLPHITGPRIIDVGSGAGLPGIPIAIARPDWHVVLLDSNHKKTIFLQQVRIELNLHNIEVITQRVEQLQVSKTFDTVITRAFSSLRNFINLAGHLHDKHNETSRLVAMKANCTEEENREIPRQYEIEKVIAITVPGLNATRQLVIIKKQ